MGDGPLKEIRQDVANLVGNATETALTAAVERSPLGVIPGVKEVAVKGAKAAARTLNNVVATGKPGGGGGGNKGGGPAPMGEVKEPSNPSGGSGASARRYSMGDGYIIERLDVKPEPFQFVLNTGIRAPVYTPLYQNATSNFNISMRMSAFSIGYTLDSFTVSSFIQTVVVSAFANAVQRAINFSIGSSITAGTLVAYMNACIRALGAYFYVKSILAYNNDPLNRNDAMTELRDALSASDMQGLYRLERVLLQTPIPPNLVNFMWWLCGNYLDGNLPSATINKIYPITGATWNPSTGIFIHNIPWGALIADLQSTSVTSSIISRAMPAWVRPSLPPYLSSPMYDANWLTVFANTNIQVVDSLAPTILRFPSITTPTSTWDYRSFTNELDGAALALASVYDITNTRWLPTMASNITFIDATNVNRLTTRLVYNNTGWKSGCSPKNDEGIINGLYTYNASGSIGTFAVSNHAGTQPVLGVNTSSVDQAALQLAEWLFSIDSIGYIAEKRVYDNSGASRIGRSRRRN